MNMESVKAVMVVAMLAAVGVAAIAWTTDRPDAMTWGFRIGSPVVALVIAGVLVRRYFRKDLAHDYLRDFVGSYFNRDGFGFSCVATAVDGVAFMDVYFQNQYDKPCLGRVALRPARGFFSLRANIETLVFQIQCAPGAYGIARLPLPIPAKCQGTRQTFEVGASVFYHDGKGKRLRFHDGVFIGADTNFQDVFGTGLAVTALMTGSVVLTTPATISVDLPDDVAEEVEATIWPEIKTFWQFGDAPLDGVGDSHFRAFRGMLLLSLREDCQWLFFAQTRCHCVSMKQERFASDPRG